MSRFLSLLIQGSRSSKMPPATRGATCSEGNCNTSVISPVAAKTAILAAYSLVSGNRHHIEFDVRVRLFQKDPSADRSALPTVQREPRAYG